MPRYLKKKRPALSYRIFSAFLAFIFTAGVVLPPQMAAAQVISTVLNLPAPGTMVAPTAAFTPAIINGITIHPENPLEFDFIIDTGDEKLEGKAFAEESTRLIKYFLAALTVPEDEMWVNLSPHEKDRIIPDGFGTTEMGRDLLAQDYILKQLTASLMYPEKELGSEFWKKIYQKAYEQYGTTEIPVNTFNKVWIVPEKAVVYENGNSAFVVKSRLRVMLEEDYQAMNKGVGTGLKPVPTDHDLSVSTEIIREVILPAIEKEVNEGKSFANLRQIYNSAILAAWFKQNLRQTLLGQVYVDKAKTKGIDVEDKTVNQKIYEQYLEAFKKGVYNYIKEDYDPATQEVIPRKYFSGGVTLNVGPQTTKGTETSVKTRGVLSVLRKGVNGIMLAAGILSTTAGDLPAIVKDGMTPQGRYVSVGARMIEVSEGSNRDYYTELSGQITDGGILNSEAGNSGATPVRLAKRGGEGKQGYLASASSPAGIDPQGTLEIVAGLVQNKIPPALERAIRQLTREKPDPAIVESPESYISDLFTLAEAKAVVTTDNPERTYFDYLLEIEKTVAKELVESLKQKFQEGKLAISQEVFDYFTENIEQAMVNLLNHDEMASLTRYSYFQILGDIMRPIYPDLYEDSKAKDFKMTDTLYSELREQMKSLTNADDALKKTILLAGMSNILERAHFNPEHFQIDDDEIEKRSIEIGSPFERLNQILNRPENKNGTILIYLDNSGELPLNMLVAESLLDRSFTVVFVAKDDFARDDLTVSDVQKHLQDWLNDDKFDWLRKYYGPRARAGNSLRVISSNSAIPGLNLASISDGHKHLRQEAILSIFHGGGNLYSSYPSALTGDRLYIYTIKEPAQIAIVEAKGVSLEKAKRGAIIAQFKASGEKGHNLSDLLSEGHYFMKASSNLDVHGGKGTAQSSPVRTVEELEKTADAATRLKDLQNAYIELNKAMFKLSENSSDENDRQLYKRRMELYKSRSDVVGELLRRTEKESLIRSGIERTSKSRLLEMATEAEERHEVALSHKFINDLKNARTETEIVAMARQFMDTVHPIEPLAEIKAVIGELRVLRGHADSYDHQRGTRRDWDNDPPVTFDDLTRFWVELGHSVPFDHLSDTVSKDGVRAMESVRAAFNKALPVGKAFMKRLMSNLEFNDVFVARESAKDVDDIYQLLYHTDASRIEALIPVMRKYLTEKDVVDSADREGLGVVSSPTTDDAFTKGGIDLNPALLDLQIRRDANGVPLPLPMQPIEDMHIEGFLPIIINITPVTNLPLLLGLADTESNTEETRPAMKARELEEISALN